MATVKGGGRRLSIWARGHDLRGVMQRCLECELSWKCESEREAITLRVVLIKRFFTLPFTIKNMKMCRNK